MSSLVEVQRIIGLSLNKIQMGRNQRGGLPLHKNLLVATVLNKARDAYMQETMYMNYRLMACGQFAAQQELEEEEEEEEAYEEDSESDVEDDSSNNTTTAHSTSSIVVDNGLREFGNAALLSMAAGTMASAKVSMEKEVEEEVASAANSTTNPQHSLPLVPAEGERNSSSSSAVVTNSNNNNNNDEGFIEDDSADCDCDARNFCHDDSSGPESSRVPFQYCFNCAPFHPSNGRGPTLVSPLLQQQQQQQQLTAATTAAAVAATSSQNAEGEDHSRMIIYDMDSGLATRNSSNNNQQRLTVKRKRHISVEETEEAVNSILMGKRRRHGESPPSGDGESSLSGDEEPEEVDCLNDSGFQEESEVFHPAFRGAQYPHLHHQQHHHHHHHHHHHGHGGNANGMEVDQITSLVSIFSFGQQLFKNSEAAIAAVAAAAAASSQPSQTDTVSAASTPPSTTAKTKPADDDSDSDSDTSSDSGHSSDDNEKVSEEGSSNNKDNSSCCDVEDCSSSVLVSGQTCAKEVVVCDLAAEQAVGGLGVAAAV